MKNLGTMVVFLISAPVHFAMAGTLREDATTLTVLKRIPIARDNDDLKKNENYAYFQDGALLKTLNFDRPFCALVVRADVNPGELLPSTIEIASTDAGGRGGVDTGQRATNLDLEHALAKRLMCTNAIKGANTPLTFEEGQRILRGYIRLDVPEPLQVE